MKQTKRLTILKNSLIKKEKLFKDKLDSHFTDVKSANGQPLNDKRNGRATLNRWEKQNDSLRKLKEGIQLTKDAIEKEEGKISDCEAAGDGLPLVINEMLKSEELIQWRKHPHIFFIKGVPKARFKFHEAKGKKKAFLSHSYTNQVTDPDARKTMIDAWNKAKKF